MNLLKWKELAKRKSELGNKINNVHGTITKRKLGEKPSEESSAKVFKPVTTKLDDVIVTNLKRPRTQLKRGRKRDIIDDIDYAREVDPYEDMDIEGLIDFGDYVPPQQNKQIVPKPPTYEEDVLEGKKQIYMNPDLSPYEAPPEYEYPEGDDDEDVDYTLDKEDADNVILDDIGLRNYDDVEKTLNQEIMTSKKTKDLC